jgi:hypothetical protein
MNTLVLHQRIDVDPSSKAKTSRFSGRRANHSIFPTQSLLPKLDYSGRKFTPSDSGAAAGFRPHLKQGVIFAQ